MVAEEIIHKVVDEIAFGLISPKDARYGVAKFRF